MILDCQTRDTCASIWRHQFPEELGHAIPILLVRTTPYDGAGKASTETLKAIADGIRSSLRLGDLVFRLQGDEILCILNGADAMTANLVRLRVADELDERGLGSADLALGTATPPDHGLSLDELVQTARKELAPIHSRLIGSRSPR